MRPKIYINGISSISAQPLDIEANPASYQKTIFPAIVPDYKEFIRPMALRRMTNATKMGIGTATMALQDARLEKPDAIITGTGEGCKQNTEKFLENLLENEKQLLSPTAFIQSTHNTIGGQIAIHLNCKEYNLTYSQNSASLEAAMLDAELQFLEASGQHAILVGGVDELSEKISSFRKLDGQLKSGDCYSLGLLKEDSPGTITSEGAHFFVLSNEKSQTTYAQFTCGSITSALTPGGIEEEMVTFLKKNNLDPETVDMVMLGNNGDNRYDHYYRNLQQNLFQRTPHLAFKHLVGDYDTASGYAIYLACQILKTGRVPSILKLNDIESDKPKNILIYNQYLGRNHCLILLSGL